MSPKLLGMVVFLCLLSAMAPSAHFFTSVDAAPAQRTAGVKIGDMVKYGRFLALWDSYSPGSSPTLGLLDINDTDWTVNTVRNVSGSTVTFEALTRYKNGSDRSTTADIDVSTGIGKGNMSFVSAGLVSGDRVYTTGDLAATSINSTSLRPYAGVYRETSLLNVTKMSFDINMSSAFWSEFFWDKFTGVLVRQFWSTAFVDEDGYLTMASIEYEMIENNIWIGASDSVAPNAVARCDAIVEVGTNVTFDGGDSRDNIGITRFTWDFGDGSSAEGLQAFHVYGALGAYNVTLTVEDVGGHSASDVLVVTVKEVTVTSQPTWLGPVGLVVFLVFLVLAWFLLKRR